MALPGFWLVVGTILACSFVLVGAKLHDASSETPQNVDSGHARASFSTVPPVPSAVNEDPSSTITYHPLAGRLLPEKIAIKRSQPEPEQAIDTTTSKTIPATNPGATRIAILLALLLLSAVLVPMALAEPTSTSMPSTSLTLPSSSASPCTTTFNATGTALSADLDLQEKDKPQTWYWIPPNSSDRRSINSVLSLLPFLLMGFFFLLPAFVGGEMEKDITIVDGMVVGRDAAPIDTNTSPVWEIFFSTTTAWPPASAMITATGDVRLETTEKPIGVAGNGGGCGPSAEAEICTEANPAVCPIVVGRKPWKVI